MLGDMVYVCVNVSSSPTTEISQLHQLISEAVLACSGGTELPAPAFSKTHPAPEACLLTPPHGAQRTVHSVTHTCMFTFTWSPPPTHTHTAHMHVGSHSQTHTHACLVMPPPSVFHTGSTAPFCRDTNAHLFLPHLQDAHTEVHMFSSTCTHMLTFPHTTSCFSLLSPTRDQPQSTSYKPPGQRFCLPASHRTKNHQRLVAF